MKITAITKFKLGELYGVLKKLGWSQAELGRRSGVGQYTISKFITLQSRPSEALARKIQNALAEAGEFIDVESMWPESFKGFLEPLVISDTRDVEPRAMLSLQSALQIPAECSVDMELVNTALDNAVAQLDSRQQVVLRQRADGKTFEEIGAKFGITRERVRQIESKALRCLRKPALIKPIEEAMRK